MRLLTLTFVATLGGAFSCASLALGLGDIQVQSALGQPLTAQIEVVGASSDDLAGLRAMIADDETFHRHGMERPSILSTIVMTVGKDSRQRPVLLLRSDETFVEPMVTFLVGLQSPSGALIREYTIMLDPPGLARPNTTDVSAVDSASSVNAASSVAAVPQPSHINTVRERAATSPDTKAVHGTYLVARGDTLDRIVRIAGARSGSDRSRMMVAIFRANPEAFGSNVNVLHSGATLHMPSAAELASISVDDAARQVAPRVPARRAAARRRLGPVASVVANAVAKQSEVEVAAAVAAQPDSEAEGTSIAVLNERVALAEKSLDQMRQQLNKPLVVPAADQVVAAPAPVVDLIPRAAIEVEPTLAPTTGMPYAALAIGLGVALTLAGGAWLYRRRGKDSAPIEPKAEQPEVAQAAPAVRRRNYHMASSLESSTPAPSPGPNPLLDGSTVEVEIALSQRAVATTAILPRIELPSASIDQDSLFNLEATINTTHVTLASDLNEESGFFERRKNPADVLRQAIEREPNRSDLRLKLLELYYSATIQNQRAFLEVAREVAVNEKLASAKEWSQIADMGRKIAPHDELFSDKSDDQAVA